MEGLEKINFGNIIDQVRNMILSPKDSLNSMGDDSNFTTIVSMNTFVFMFAVPLAMFFSLTLIGSGGTHMGIAGWLFLSAAIMFYSLVIVYFTAKIAWKIKEATEFVGSENRMNKIVVLASSAFFLTSGVYWLLGFIGKIVELAPFLATISGAAGASYVLFMGFDTDSFKVDESKKMMFIGIIIGLLSVFFLVLNFIIAKQIAVQIVGSALSKMASFRY